MEWAPTGKSSPKHLSKVTRGFRRADSLIDLENENENGVAADWEIITETPSKGERGFGRARSPYCLRKSQRNNFKW
jgi:hypothetical protein